MFFIVWAQPAKKFGSNVAYGGASPSSKNMLAVWSIAPVIEKSIMATGGTSRWTVTVFSMRSLDLTAAWFRLLYIDTFLG